MQSTLSLYEKSGELPYMIPNKGIVEEFTVRAERLTEGKGLEDPQRELGRMVSTSH